MVFAAFSFAPPAAWGHGYLQFWRAVWATREGGPVLSRYANPHGLPPFLAFGVVGLKPIDRSR